MKCLTRRRGAAGRQTIGPPGPTCNAYAAFSAFAGRISASIADVFGIDALRFSDVFSAADDGSTVGEHGQVVAADRRANEIFVATDGADCRQLGFDLVERQRRAAGKTELNGIAAAKNRGMTAAFAAEPRK